jgi:hypothetical protein
MLATARTPSTGGNFAAGVERQKKPVTAGPPATACSKGTAETPTTPSVTPGTAIAERPAKINHQELKGRQQQQECQPQSGCKQQ